MKVVLVVVDFFYPWWGPIIWYRTWHKQKTKNRGRILRWIQLSGDCSPDSGTSKFEKCKESVLQDHFRVKGLVSNMEKSEQNQRLAWKRHKTPVKLYSLRTSFASFAAVGPVEVEECWKSSTSWAPAHAVPCHPLWKPRSHPLTWPSLILHQVFAT